MARTIDPIRKAKYKENRLKGMPNAPAMVGAGYSPKTAYHNIGPKNKLLKTVNEEIFQELKLADITPEWCISERHRIKSLAEKKEDFTNINRAQDAIEQLTGVAKPQNNITNIFTIASSVDVKDADVLTSLALRRRAELSMPDSSK